MGAIHIRRRFTRAGVAAILAVAATLSATLAVAVLLLVAPAAEARASAPGDLIWAERIGTSGSGAGVSDMAAGPRDAIAMAGSRDGAPMVAKFTPAGLEWTRTYEASGGARAVVFDRTGNVYVAALVYADHESHTMLLKFDAGGVLLWSVRCADGAGDDPATAYGRGHRLVVDKAGDVILVGTTDTTDRVGHRFIGRVIVLKYHPDGSLAWPAAAVYEPAAGDATVRTFELADVALDKAGNVYVSGTLFSAWYRVRSDMEGLVLKFSGADGALVASRTDECPPGTESRFAGISVRGSRVAVAGMALDMTDAGAVIDAHGLVAGFDLVLEDAHRRAWDPDDMRYETFNDVELDPRGDVYVTGSQAAFTATGPFAQVAVTLQFDRSLSTVLWSAVYAPEAADADTYLLARDANGGADGHPSRLRDARLPGLPDHQVRRVG